MLHIIPACPLSFQISCERNKSLSFKCYEGDSSQTFDIKCDRSYLERQSEAALLTSRELYFISIKWSQISASFYDLDQISTLFNLLEISTGNL